MSFEKHSNFNNMANFSEVKFGENKPVLEVELNEMQQIQNEARADIIRDTMPSGFVTLGDIDYDYCAINNNQIKLKTESIAYVNGYRITIPKDTIIEIEESDKVREDLVFLEVWKEAVTDIDELKRYGGEGNDVIDNHIKDERYPVATSQRVALKYRIRHVADIDFNKVWVQGNEGSDKFIGLNGDGSVFANIIAQGGLEKPYAKPNFRFTFQNQWTKDKDYGIVNRTYRDPGLWSILPDQSVDMAKALNCIDGAVYAIPMFRLKRKPNVGLASPFEYKKIHNQLDPKKFAHLVGQENVEKVHSVNIKGKTFKNLITHAKQQGSGALNVNVSPDIVTFDTNASWGKIGFLVNGEPNTKYIFHCSDFYKGEKSVEFYVRFSDSIHANAQPLNKIDPNTSTFTTDSSGVFMFSFEISGGVSGAYVKYPILMKYSEWEEQLRGKKIVGVQSLGEESNNSITVENNLVEEGTYVHELQNHILPTHPEVTPVTWGEDVIIPPEVEIELKNGEEVIQTITQLPVKLETTGEEKLHVKTMKGQTLVNSFITSYYQHGGRWGIIFFKSELMVKGKKYIIVLQNLPENCQWSVTNYDGSVMLLNYTDQLRGVFTSSLNGFEDTFALHINDGETIRSLEELQKVKPMLIEYQDGMENWDIPYFEGMKSVEMPVLKTIGKNLFDFNKVETNDRTRGIWDTTINNGVITSIKKSSGGGEFGAYATIKVEPSTTYTLRMEQYKNGKSHGGQIYVYNNSSIWGNGLLMGYGNSDIVISTKADTKYITIGINYDNDIAGTVLTTKNIQLEKSSTSTQYEPYKSNILTTSEEVTLRGIGEVHDELNLLTGELTQRIGGVVLDGTTKIILGSKTSDTIVEAIIYFDDSTPKKHIVATTGISDKAITVDSHVDTMDYVRFNTGSTDYFICGILINKLETADVDGVKKYLQSNPITVQYQLETESVKTVDLTEDDYVGKSKVTYQLAEPLRKVGTHSDFIKGNTLYSNIGVKVLNGSENIAQRGETLENTLLFVTHLTDLGIKSNLIYSDKFDGTDISWNEIITSDKEFIRLYTNDTNALYIRILKSKLATQDVNGFKKWLQANPVTIYYVKANPVEIPLKEVSPLDVDFSYNRQFKRGYENYLKELPNGVKDVVENGKVKRNVGLVSLGDFAPDKWNLEFSNENYLAFDLRGLGFHNDNPYTSNYRFSNVLPFITHEQYLQTNTEGLRFSSIPALVISKSRLTTPDTSGLVTWLRSNNVSMMYQLKEPTTEALTEENKRYVPYMPLNSYVGSLYVADGINQTKFLTDFSPSGYEVQTSHHYFSNEFNMFKDIKRKKSPYGHKTVPVSLTANLHDGELYTNTGFVLNDGSYETATDWIASKNLIPVTNGKTYHIKLDANDTDITSNRRYVYVYKYDVNGKYLKSRLDLGMKTQFTSDFTGQVLIVIKTKNVSHIQVTEDKAYTENIPYIRGEKFTAGLEKHEIEDLRHKVSLTGFDYSQLLQDSFLKLIKGELS